jgi:hypothetical protein
MTNEPNNKIILSVNTWRTNHVFQKLNHNTIDVIIYIYIVNRVGKFSPSHDTLQIITFVEIYKTCFQYFLFTLEVVYSFIVPNSYNILILVTYLMVLTLFDILAKYAKVLNFLGVNIFWV